MTCSCCVMPADDDGLISFEEFLVSYAKPKPIGKNMLIMAINTAAIFFILQAPFLDVMLKVTAGALCCFVLVVVQLWHAIGVRFAAMLHAEACYSTLHNATAVITTWQVVVSNVSPQHLTRAVLAVWRCCCACLQVMLASNLPHQHLTVADTCCGVAAVPGCRWCWWAC